MLTRAELARELRTIADARKVLGITLNAKHIGTQDDHVLEVLLEAAAALEEEERNGRRWRAFSDAWGDRYKVFIGDTMRPSEPRAPFIHVYYGEDIPPGWHRNLDAALDAWLEERGKGRI